MPVKEATTTTPTTTTTTPDASKPPRSRSATSPAREVAARFVKLAALLEEAKPTFRSAEQQKQAFALINEGRTLAKEAFKSLFSDATRGASIEELREEIGKLEKIPAEKRTAEHFKTLGNLYRRLTAAMTPPAPPTQNA
jgi:hypothetical protein